MAKPVPTSAVLSHWHRLIENLETSSLEFYAAVETAIGRREVPQANPSRVDWREGGMLSARRGYLRVSRGRHRFDICAAPFGSGFFVSWWLAEPRPSPVLPTAAAITAFGVLWYTISGSVGPTQALVSALALVIVLLFAIGGVLSENESEVYIAVIPIIGTVFEYLFRPMTYYRIDTAFMFQEAVHAAVLEVIDGLTEAKGLRPLSELERKPILREFYK